MAKGGDFCKTVDETNTPHGEVELIAAGRMIWGGTGVLMGRLSMVIPGEVIRAEFQEVPTQETWAKAFASLIREIKKPRHQYKPIFREPAVIRLLEEAASKVASLPVPVQ